MPTPIYLQVCCPKKSAEEKENDSESSDEVKGGHANDVGSNGSNSDNVGSYDTVSNDDEEVAIIGIFTAKDDNDDEVFSSLPVPWLLFFGLLLFVF